MIHWEFVVSLPSTSTTLASFSTVLTQTLFFCSIHRYYDLRIYRTSKWIFLTYKYREQGPCVLPHSHQLLSSFLKHLDIQPRNLKKYIILTEHTVLKLFHKILQKHYVNIEVSYRNLLFAL